MRERLQTDLGFIPEVEPAIHTVKLGRIAWTQRRIGKMLIDIVDDVAGFGDHDAIVNQYRHEPLRVDCDELRRQMLVVRKSTGWLVH